MAPSPPPQAKTAARATMAFADWASRALRGSAGVHSRAVSSSGGSLQVIEGQGKGPIPTVLLLHGLGGAATDWMPLMAQLRPVARRIIAVDLPGHGLNPDLPAGKFLEAEADLYEVLNELVGDAPALVYGNSLGGIVAFRYALAHSDKVGALMLSSPGGARTTEADLRQVLACFDFRNRSDLFNFVRRVFPSARFSVPLVAMAMSVRLSRPFVREFIQTTSNRDTLSAEQVGQLSMPVLLSWGTAERVFPPSYLAFFREHLPDHAIVEEPEGYGHSPFLTQSSKIARRMKRFWVDSGRPLASA